MVADEVNNPSHNDGHSSKEKTKKKKIVKEIDTLVSLIREVYSQKPKRISLKKSEIRLIRSEWKIEQEDRESLLEVSSNDFSLERTRELLLLSCNLEDSKIVAEQLRFFVRDVLLRHPAFHKESLLNKLNAKPDSVSELAAIKSLMLQDFESLAWPSNTPEMKSKEIELCRKNSLYCLLLWFYAAEDLSYQNIVRILKNEIWNPAALRFKNDEKKMLRSILLAKEPDSLGIACALYEQLASEKMHQAERAQERLEEETNKTQELKKKNALLEGHLRDAEASIEKLRQEINSIRLDHENEKSHLCDDYEELRGRVLRRFREEVSLLDEGLHALRRDPPKVHVMEDHAERAIDSLKREMARIRGDE